MQCLDSFILNEILETLYLNKSKKEHKTSHLISNLE